MAKTPTLAAIAAVLLGASIYTVDAREVAVVTMFGAQVVRNVQSPGLYLRAPWPIHQVQRFDRRSRLMTGTPAEVLTKDKKNLVVEPFVLWRVADPERFLEAVGTAELAEAQLGDMVNSRIAAAFGRRDFNDLLSPTGAGESMLPAELSVEVAALAGPRLGVEVITVQLRQVGLPLQNEQSIYERMRAERTRIARAYRSEGEEEAARIRAIADLEAAKIAAAAEKEAAAIRARAEGNATALYANAHKADPGFYRFMSRLDAAAAIVDEDTVLVVDSSAPVLSIISQGAP
jgi:membrane protease subunit HflC